MSDRPEALEPPEDEDHDAIHIIYSHGSVHRYLLLNTEQEIDRARKKNASAFIPHFQRHGVLVIGYSGWSDATMDALSQCQRFDGNLYWCDVFSEDEAPSRLGSAALELLEQKNGNAFYVPIAGADELMLALHKSLGLGDAPRFISDPISEMIEDLQSVDVPDARGVKDEPSPIDTLKDYRDRTLTRLSAAKDAFDRPEILQAENFSAYEPAVTAQILDEARKKSGDGLNEEAIALWTKVVEDAQALPAYRAGALINRGIAYGRKDQLKESVADFTAAIDVADISKFQRAMAFHNRGITHAKAGNIQEAISDQSEMIATDEAPANNRARALAQRGRAKYRLEPSDIVGMRDDLKAALAIDPSLTVARFSLGLALLLLGQASEARMEYQRALSQSVSTRDIRESLNDLLEASANKEIEGAVEIISLLKNNE